MIVSTFDIFSQFWGALQHGAILPLGYWNYLILFVFVIIQGPLVKLLSGALVTSTFMNLFAVILVSVAASLTADLVWFRLGRLGNLQRYLRRKSPRQKQVFSNLQKGMRRHYFKILLLGKMSAGMAVPAMLAAGVSKIPWRKWFLAALTGEIIYTSIMVLLGYFAAESLQHVNRFLKIFGVGISVLILLFLVIYLPITLKKIVQENNTTLEPGSTD